jgi:hypothetical protein
MNCTSLDLYLQTNNNENMERLKFGSQAEFAAAIIQHGKLRDTQGNVYFFEPEHCSLDPFRFLGKEPEAENQKLALAWHIWKIETFEIVKEAIPDKAPVWAWDEDQTHRRLTGFYDSRNNCVFLSNGIRNGGRFQNYKVIPEDKIPEWMKEAQKTLED